MKTVPYLFFDGRCAEAFRTYAGLLGAEVTGTITYGESPMADDFPEEGHDRVIHTHLKGAGVELMGSDTPPGQGVDPQRRVHISVSADGVEEAERLFGALAEGGEVSMPLDRTFFAERFGMVVDRFGTPWMVESAGKST